VAIGRDSQSAGTKVRRRELYRIETVFAGGGGRMPQLVKDLRNAI
jgi:hypothetical protein